MIRKRHPPAGARPGTLAIHESSPPPKIRRITYTAAAIEEDDVAGADSLGEIQEGAVTWIDVQGLGDEETLRRLGSIFSLHPLALEDVVNVPVRPKSEAYDHHLLIVTRMVVAGGADAASIEQVSLLIGRNYVLSFQEKHGGDVFDPVRARLRYPQGHLRRSGSDYLGYALWDAIIDAYFPVVESLTEELEEMEDVILGQPTPAMLRRLSRIKRWLLTLRRAVAPQREAAGAVIRDESPFVGDEVRVFLRDVYDHCVQTTEAIDGAREMVSSQMNLYLTAISNRTNDVMKVLTIVASIFVPLTFMAGIYGMNFEYMPELGAHWGYPLLLAAMAIVALVMLGLFYRKGWIGSSRQDDEKKRFSRRRGSRP